MIRTSQLLYYVYPIQKLSFVDKLKIYLKGKAKNAEKLFSQEANDKNETEI